MKSRLLILACISLCSPVELRAEVAAGSDHQNPKPYGASTAATLARDISAANNSEKVSDQVVIKAIDSFFALPDATSSEEAAFGLMSSLGLKSLIQKGNPTVVANTLKPYLKNHKTVWGAVGHAGASPQIAAALVPELMENLKDENPSVRYFAALGLGVAGPEAKAAVSQLAKILRTEKDTEAKEFMAQALGQIGVANPAVIKALTQVILENSVNSMYAEEALEVLQFDPEPYLSDWIACSNLTLVSDVVLAKLTSIGAKAVPQILESARKKEIDEKLNECDMLVAVGEPAIPTLSPLLKSEVPLDRKVAVSALAGIRNKKGDDPEWLIPFLKDPERHVVYEAIIGYGESRAPVETKLKILGEMLSSKDKIAQSLASSQLGEMGASAAPSLPQLTALMKSSKDNALSYAIDILAIDPNHPEARSSINALLKSNDEEDIWFLLNQLSIYPKTVASFREEIEILSKRTDVTDGLQTKAAYLLEEIQDNATSATKD